MFWEIIKDYLFLNLDYYIDGIDFQINLFLASIAIGICIACVIITVKRRNMGSIIGRLMRHEAYDEGSAKTLDELKIKKSFLVRRSLSARGQLTAIVACVGGYPFEHAGSTAKLDLEGARFYISEAGRDRATRINGQQPPSYLNTVLGCILVILVFGIIMLFVPDILSFITGVK